MARGYRLGKLTGIGVMRRPGFIPDPAWKAEQSERGSPATR
jgi:hypothetical protein